MAVAPRVSGGKRRFALTIGEGKRHAPGVPRPLSPVGVALLLNRFKADLGAMTLTGTATVRAVSPRTLV
jgi:hypothetical protein